MSALRGINTLLRCRGEVTATVTPHKGTSMSWSISATGYPAPVLETIKRQIGGNRCSEPEETIKEQIVAVVKASLVVYPSDHPVKVSASGSQSSGSDGKYINQFQVSVEPMWGFLTK